MVPGNGASLRARVLVRRQLKIIARSRRPSESGGTAECPDTYKKFSTSVHFAGTDSRRNMVRVGLTVGILLLSFLASVQPAALHRHAAKSFRLMTMTVSSQCEFVDAVHF